MREGGGCGVLVSILASGDKQPRELRDTVLRSEMKQEFSLETSIKSTPFDIHWILECVPFYIWPPFNYK